MSERRRLKLFEGVGIELEYMIVTRETLDVSPISDLLIAEVAGEPTSDVDRGAVAWSNELVLHVIELKTNGPADTLEGLDALFSREVRAIDEILRDLDACLLPGAMHPWMHPEREARLWPHEHNAIYEAFHRVFDCRGHGWSNLQSVHINFPFAGDEEFARLHAAMRIVLPILPAIAASSPFAEGRSTGFLDTRMELYRTNCQRVPSVTGAVIPERVFDESSYESEVFARMYRDIAPLDPAGVLQEPFLNARGAMPHFDRGSIEIRVLDVQECPRADLAIAAVTGELVRGLVEERWSTLEEQKSWEVAPLAALMNRAIRDAEEATLATPGYARTLGLPSEPRTLRELWDQLLARIPSDHLGGAWSAPLERIQSSGPLARRVLRAAGTSPSRSSLERAYRTLSACLLEGRLFP